MKIRAKQLVGWTLGKLGLITLVRKYFPIEQLTILMFHKVRKDNFEEMIRHLKKHYYIASEQEVYDYYFHHKTLPKNSVLLTFDDGYRNNYIHAYPILKKYDAPAIIFLTTKFIDAGGMPWYDKIEYALSHTKVKKVCFDGINYSLSRRGKKKLMYAYYEHAITTTPDDRDKIINDLLAQTKIVIPKKLPEKYAFITWKEINEMMPLVSFGAHTHTHPVLTTCTPEECAQEISLSKKILAKKIGHQPKSFCYPNGNYNPEVVNIVGKQFSLGYSSDFSRNTLKTNPLMLKRIGINVADTFSIFAFKLTRLSNIFRKNRNLDALRVVLITNYYFPVLGGITTTVNNLKNSLQSKGVDASVLTYPNIFRSLENGVPALLKKSVHRLLVLLFLSYGFLFLLSVRITNKNVIAHSQSANFCARLAVLGRFIGVKSVHSFRTTVKHMGEQVNPAAAAYLNKVDCLTAVSESLAEESKHYYAIDKPIVTIRNGISPIFTSYHRPIKKKSGVLRLLFVGNLLPVKDPLLFVRTVYAINKIRPVRATMIGDGILKQQICDAIKTLGLEKIILLRKGMSQEKLLSYYGAADVYVLTSKSEGLANTLLEAMACKTPVVTTLAGGVVEIVSDKKLGLVVDSRDPIKLAKAILQASKGNSVGNRLRDHVIQNFKWEKSADRFILLYQRVLGKRGVHLEQGSEA